VDAQIESPDFNDVALFVHVVRAASFSTAAKAQGVPVSTVSRRIARLESRLNTRLLERTTRKLHLTDVGQRYFAHAERALDELVEGSSYVRALYTTPRGRVRMTMPIGLGPIVATALAPYLEANPNVVIEMDLTDRRVDLVAEGMDIAIRTGKPSDSPDFVARKIKAATRQMFASAEYLARKGRPTKVDDLIDKGHDLIATRSTSSGASWNLTENGRPRTLTFKPRLVVNELMASRAAAIAGVGIVLLPSPEIAKGPLERILPKVIGEQGGIWLLYPARRSITAAVRSCVDHLQVALNDSRRTLA